MAISAVAPMYGVKENVYLRRILLLPGDIWLISKRRGELSTHARVSTGWQNCDKSVLILLPP